MTRRSPDRRATPPVGDLHHARGELQVLNGSLISSPTFGTGAAEASRSLRPASSLTAAAARPARASLPRPWQPGRRAASHSNRRRHSRCSRGVHQHRHAGGGARRQRQHLGNKRHARCAGYAIRRGHSLCKHRGRKAGDVNLQANSLQVLNGALNSSPNCWTGWWWERRGHRAEHCSGSRQLHGPNGHLRPLSGR